MNKFENFIDGISLCKVKIPVRIRMDTFIGWVLKEVSSRPEHMPFGTLLIKTFFVDEFIGKDSKKNNKFSQKLGKIYPIFYVTINSKNLNT